MTSINNIVGLQDQLKKVKDNEGLSNVRTQRSTTQDLKSSENTVRSGGDSVDISSAGRSLLSRSEEVQQYVQELNTVEILEPKELETIRERVAGDFYSQPKVEEQLAEAIVSSGVSKSETDIPVKDVDAEYSDRLNEIKERVKNDYYSNSEVVDVIAEKMINPAS